VTRPPVDPRRVAHTLLLAVETSDAYANLLLPRLIAEARLDRRDSAFVTELGYGALRRQGSLDTVLAACASRPLERLDPPVRAALRLGAQQLLFLRVPPHAAVSASVSLAPTRGRGFANAVLRRVAERSWREWLEALAPPDEVGRLALEHAHPPWVVRAVADRLPAGELAAALAADNDPPAVTLAARRVERDALLAEIPGAEPGRWSPYAVRLPAGDPAPWVRDGRAGVQDEGSQLVALALARAEVPGRDEIWLDAAAGPGGKAALLAGLAGTRGARLLAAELQFHRAKLVARSVAGLAGTPVVADSTRPAWRDSGVDRVLLDAPCTGLGALRRRPESRWRRVSGDVPRLAALQRALLARALDAARPGGVVAYATCSPHLAETVAVVEAVLRARGDAQQEDARPLLGVPDVGDGPHAQLWPHRHGTDAMFLAIMRKVR
jgi:16S rRNA (cytosine967-C5)-methyltransferase